MLNDSIALDYERDKVEQFISMLQPGRVKVTEKELEKLQDKFMEFSALLHAYSLKYSNVTEDVPTTTTGEEMTTVWWKQVKQNLLEKVTNHRMRVEAATVQHAVTVDQASALTEFEKRDLEIKEKHLAVVEENRKKLEEAERTKVETERIKANALQSLLNYMRSLIK